MNFRSAIRNQLKRKVGSFLLNQTVPPPLVYFLIFVYAHYNRQQINNYDALMLSFVIVKLALIANFNCAFMAAPFLSLNNPVLGLLFFGIACLSCNQKWKIYLLLIAIGDALTQLASVNSFFLAIAATYICSDTYQNMIFGSIKDNKQYFTGFFVIAVYNCLEIFLTQTGNAIQPFLIVLILGASFLMGISIIKTGIERLHTMNYNQIHNVRLMFHYITLLKQDIKISFVRKTKIQLHRRKCMNSSCFCHNPEHLMGHNYFIRQLYQNAAQQFNHQFDSIFFEDYLIFLANNFQLHKALYLLSAWKPQNYFTFTAKLRCGERIANQMMNLDSSNIYELEYQYALTYDGHLRQLMESIHSILQQKIIFWTEVSRQNPLMIKMQETGSVIVEQMYLLNCFYSEVIKRHEKKLYSFDATVIYSMYLLSTTNFKEYAEIIIKSTSKLLQEVFVFEKSVAETFAIRVRLQNDKMSYLKDKEEYLSMNINGKQNSKIKNSYKLAIDAVSRGFCSMINISKNQLIGEELNFIIPDSYKEVHKSRLNDLFNFDCEQLTYIKPYALLHKELRLPIRGLGSTLFMGYVSIKFMLDIEIGVTFIATIKRVNDKAKNAIVTVDGEILEKQDGFIEQIVNHSEVERYIAFASQSWQNTKTIKQEKFNIMINSISYSVTVNSPFLSLFLDKLNLTDKNPPIHIQMFSQQFNKHKNPDDDNKMTKELKKMENAIAYQDNESSASTKSGTSAINTLSSFSESNSIPIYRYVLIAYIIVVALCVSSNLVGYLTADLSWNNTIRDNNPISDILNMQKIQKITSKLVSNLWDMSQFFMRGPYLNMTKVNSYFGPNGYYVATLSLFKQMESQIRLLIQRQLKDSSPVLQKDIQQKWQSQLTVTNYFVVPSKTSMMNQNLTYLQLMLNFVVDTNLIVNQRISNDILLAISFNENLVNLQNTSNLLLTVNQQIDQDSKRSFLIQIGMIIVILLLLVPGWLFLRARLPLHEKIFDLLASIDVDLVVKQINSLNYISNILKNYQEQSETLKNNVMDYQENIIYSKRHSSRRASVNNQIIMGLEKYDRLENNNEKESSFLHSERQELMPMATSTRMPHRMSKFSSKSVQSFTSMREQEQMRQLKQKQRKRDGEISYKGSQSDPTKKILFRHLAFYIIILVFVVFLGVGVYLSSNYMQSIKSKNNTVHGLMDQNIIETQLFMLGQYYFRYGMESIANLAGSLDYIVDFVEKLPSYDYNSQHGYSVIYPNCSTLDANSSTLTSTQKYCEYNYSYLILIGEFGALYKQSFESRSAADSNLAYFTAHNQLNTYNQIINNVSENIFYMQSLNNKIENMTYALVDMQFADIINQSVNYQKIKLFLLVLAFCWAIVCSIIGVTIIISMKRQYFKQVYMITFLNQEMITKSKRVESFLDSLLKSST